MNIRKPVDYSVMYAAIDTLVVSDMEQTELFCEIGRLIDERPEKGAAVAAAEYINTTRPDKSGFSPRSLRRMRDFYRAYKNDFDLMEKAMHVSWSLNAIIIENCEEHDVRKWYVMACLKFGWSKQELLTRIEANAHEDATLNVHESSTVEQDDKYVVDELAVDERKRSASVSHNTCTYKEPVYGLGERLHTFREKLWPSPYEWMQTGVRKRMRKFSLRWKWFTSFALVQGVPDIWHQTVWLENLCCQHYRPTTFLSPPYKAIHTSLHVSSIYSNR